MASFSAVGRSVVTGGRGIDDEPSRKQKGCRHRPDAKVSKQSAKSSTASVLDALAERLVSKAMEKRLTRTASSTVQTTALSGLASPCLHLHDLNRRRW